MMHPTKTKTLKANTTSRLDKMVNDFLESLEVRDQEGDRDISLLDVKIAASDSDFVAMIMYTETKI